MLSGPASPRLGCLTLGRALHRGPAAFYCPQGGCSPGICSSSTSWRLAPPSLLPTRPGPVPCPRPALSGGSKNPVGQFRGVPRPGYRSPQAALGKAPPACCLPWDSWAPGVLCSSAVNPQQAQLCVEVPRPPPGVTAFVPHPGAWVGSSLLFITIIIPLILGTQVSVHETRRGDETPWPRHPLAYHTSHCCRQLGPRWTSAASPPCRTPCSRHRWRPGLRPRDSSAPACQVLRSKAPFSLHHTSVL